MNSLVMVAQRAATGGGLAGLASLVVVLVGEAMQGEAFMGSAWAVAAGWASFAGVCLLVVGLAGLAQVVVGRLPGAGSAALAALVLATAATVGATATLALVVPVLVERAPDIATSPPAVIPATFIASGLLMGVSALFLVSAVQRSATPVGRGLATFVRVAAVVAIVPLPSRYFLLSLALAGLIAGLARTSDSRSEVALAEGRVALA